MIVMFLFFSNEPALAALDQAGRNGLVERHVTFNHDVLERQVSVLATRGLQPSSAARTVRPHAGADPVVTTGPHAPADEALAGFYLVECRDLDEATELARRYPMPAGLGCIELRPVMQSWDYAPSVDVAAGPADVWRHYADVAGWPSWEHDLAAVTLDGPLTTGATGTMRPAVGPAIAVRIVSAAPDVGYVCESEVAAGVWLRMEHDLAALPGGGTRITHRALVPRAALDVLGLEFSPALNEGMRSTLQRLRTALEPAAPVQETSDAR